MWNKIKEFFKKFWFVFIVPIALCIVHLFTGPSKKAELKGKEKEQKKDIKEDKKEIKETEKKVETSEKDVKKSHKKVEEAFDKSTEALDKCEDKVKEDLKSKKERDEKANKYLPNL